MAKRRVSLNLLGGEQLAAKLASLPDDVAGDALREAAQAGADVLQQSIVEKTPRGAGDNTYKGESIGHMADHIITEVAGDVRPERVSVEIGPDGKHWYGAAVEKGHPIVRDGKVVGNAPPHPFMRPAFDEATAAAEKAVAAALKRRLKL